VVTAFLGLGSNLGDREANISNALAEIGRLAGCELLRTSSLYETDPVGIREQPDFLNAVAEVRTDMRPREFLSTLREVERRAGRERTLKWGPRIIDIDILLYGDELLTEDNLEIPHPEMHRRAFVLTPLAEIAPKVKHPGLNVTIQELSEKVGSEGVRKYETRAEG
jgi:2-amino-4-hydroxy-6-hydroxymethyldihydropteridine diphosphokinase